MSMHNYQQDILEDSSQGQSVAERAICSADQIGDKQASVLVRIVSQSHGVTVKELFSHSRSRAPIAATRQLVMYLMHVLLGRSLTEVGRFFHRDRTTVSYACRIVEDLRDLPDFDEETSILERNIEQVISSAARIEQFLAQADDNV